MILKKKKYLTSLLFALLLLFATSFSSNEAYGFANRCKTNWNEECASGSTEIDGGSIEWSIPGQKLN